MKSVDNVFYAHLKEGEPIEKWQRLEDNLEKCRGIKNGFAG